MCYRALKMKKIVDAELVEAICHWAITENMMEKRMGKIGDLKIWNRIKHFRGQNQSENC